jgi:hypothetical protein
LRSKLLLAPEWRLSTLRAAQGIYTGLFTNELVPFRLGELVRAFLVSRWLSFRFMDVLASKAIERFLDALWLAVGIGLAVIFVPLPKVLVEVAASHRIEIGKLSGNCCRPTDCTENLFCKCSIA